MGIVNIKQLTFGVHCTGIAYLTATLTVERRGVKNYGAVTLVDGIYCSVIAQNGKDFGLGAVACVAGEPSLGQIGQ